MLQMILVFIYTLYFVLVLYYYFIYQFIAHFSFYFIKKGTCHSLATDHFRVIGDTLEKEMFKFTKNLHFL